MAEAKSPAPLRAGLLTGLGGDLAGVCLAGCMCPSCGETALGEAEVCPNCGRAGVEQVALGRHGTLWSFTVIRHRPPGDYRGPETFAPFGLGLVDLDERIRVLSPIRCAVDRLAIGMALEFQPYIRHDPEGDVVAFCFAPPGLAQTNV